MKDVEVFYFFQPPPAGTRKKPSLTRWKMTIEEGKKRFPDGWPDLRSREIRRECETAEDLANAYKTVEGYGARPKTKAEIEFQAAESQKRDEH